MPLAISQILRGTPVQQPVRRPAPTSPAPQANPLGGILTNPAVAQADLSRNQAIQQANAYLRQGRSQSLINYGDPGLARALGINVDPNTEAAAQANQYSTLAQLGRQNEQATRGIFNNLAGRGLLHSGDLGYLQGQQALGNGQNLYNAYQGLLGDLNQQLGSYLGTTQSANDAYTQALLQAFAQLGANPLGLYGA